jgi:hypothetical protein
MSSAIEEICAKALNRKEFKVFVEMLLLALEQRRDSVFLDLLTRADIVKLSFSTLLSPASRLIATCSLRKCYETEKLAFRPLRLPLPAVPRNSAPQDPVTRISVTSS